MKTNVFFNYFRIICLVLFIGIIALSIPSSAKEFILLAEFNENPIEHEVNITAEGMIYFRILDNTTHKFVTHGTIKIADESLAINQTSLLEAVKDSVAKRWAGFKGLVINVKDGEDTWGNNSEYYAEKIFEEDKSANDYQVVVTGYIGHNETKNKITVNVKSNYINQIVGNPEKTYEIASLNELNNRSLKYHKDTKNVDLLIVNINKFIDSSNELQNKIKTLNNPNKTEIVNLPVDNVITYKKDVIKFIELVEKESNEMLIKDQLSRQLKQVNSDTENVTIELAGNLNEKKKVLLEKELEAAENNEKAKKAKFSELNSTFQSDIFNPAGALVFLGLIVGYVIVNRWKKESEYLGLMTSNANITSPITIATIITIIILILIAIIINQYGNFGMFKYLI